MFINRVFFQNQQKNMLITTNFMLTTQELIKNYKKWLNSYQLLINYNIKYAVFFSTSLIWSIGVISFLYYNDFLKRNGKIKMVHSYFIATYYPSLIVMQFPNIFSVNDSYFHQPFVVYIHFVFIVYSILVLLSFF